MNIAFTSDGRLIIASDFNDRIRVFSDVLNIVSTLVGTSTRYQDGTLESTSFETSRSVDVDENGSIFVADSVSNQS